MKLSVIIPINIADLDIGRCIKSLLNDPVLDLQIIVAANSDRRDELKRIQRKVRKLYSGTPCVKLLSIPKAGKANAINKALRYVKNEIVLIGDADTYFCQRGLNRCLSAIMNDKTVVAVTGNVDVIERNFLSRIQRFEYRRVFRIFRPLWNRINANLIISGCAGIFRTESLFEVGLYDTSTVAEDFEITLRLHDHYIRHGREYKIQYINTTVAKTDVPMDFRSLIRQRRRWFLGFVQVTRRYRRILLHPEVYRRIYLPFVFSILTEKWSSILKWVFIALSIGKCIHHHTFALQGVLLGFFNLWMFAVLFNTALMKKLKHSNRDYFRIMSVILLTFCLMMVQFIIKDTNVLHFARKKNRSTGNKWL